MLTNLAYPRINTMAFQKLATNSKFLIDVSRCYMPEIQNQAKQVFT